MNPASPSRADAAAPIPALPQPIPSFQVPRPPVSPLGQPSRRPKWADASVGDPLGGRAGWIVVSILLLLFARPIVQLVRLVGAELAVSAIEAGELRR